jgi:hypothetical protein
MNIIDDDILIVKSVDMSKVKFVEYWDKTMLIDIIYDDQQKFRISYETEFAYFKMKNNFVEYFGSLVW